MPGTRGSQTKRPLSEFLLAPRSGLQHFPWIVLAVAVVLVVVVVFVIDRIGATSHPLAPLGASVVFISVIAAALAGTLVGLATALVGVAMAFAMLADFSTGAATATAVVAAVIWCGTAVATGLVGRNLRRQVARREAALEQALSRSLSARDKLERVLDFSPQFFRGESLAEVADTICETALTTFGADSACVYALKDDALEILALTPAVEGMRRGFAVSVSEFPDLETMLADHRPSYVRDVTKRHPAEQALRLTREFGIVSAVRVPIVGPVGLVGLLGLGWHKVTERPADGLMAIMQRFADQAAIAWQNALKVEAQRQADDMHETLHRVVALAPTFHITGTTEKVANAICEAALKAFDCQGVSIYRVEGDRLRVLDCAPPLESLPAGRTFPLSEDMPLTHEIRSPAPTFIPDVADTSRSVRPWPPEIVRQAATRSALYVPLRFNERGPQNLLILNWDKPREQPDASFLVIVQRFADQAALALTNASAERLHARLEASLLPTTPVVHPLLRAITRYRTGEQRLRLGGDFVGSTVTADGRLHFVIGDVSGHGPDAAALGATLRSTWKALALAGESTPKTVAVMRDVLITERVEPNAFATIVAGWVDVGDHSLSCINAGHPPPLLITDKVTPLASPPTSPLGVDKRAERPLQRFPLPERWSVFCYTDGLIDARVTPGVPERYGEERLKKRLGAWAGTTPTGTALDDLMAEIETASGGAFADDVALLLISTKNAERGARA
jgi:serine phosphatase RsbU (regulator of sigma subunit)